MEPFTATVTGNYPRPVAPTDTLKKPSVPPEVARDMIRWAVGDQVSLGLEVVTDGEGYRENMYWFYQMRLGGVSTDDMVHKSFGEAGFGIECARVTGKIGNPDWRLAEKWKTAREAAPAGWT